MDNGVGVDCGSGVWAALRAMDRKKWDNCNSINNKTSN